MENSGSRPLRRRAIAKEAHSTTRPPEVPAFINGAQPRFKDEPKPDQFCGREGELKAMMRIITQTLCDSEGVGTRIETIDLVTRALLCNGERGNKLMLEQLVNRGIAQLEDPERDAGPANADKRVKEAGRVIQRLLHTGMIDRTDHLPDPADRELVSYYCPIPCRLDYDRRRLCPSRAAMDELLAEQELDHGEHTPMAKR